MRAHPNCIQPLAKRIENRFAPEVTEVTVMVIIHVRPNFLERVEGLIRACVFTIHEKSC